MVQAGTGCAVGWAQVHTGCAVGWVQAVLLGGPRLILGAVLGGSSGLCRMRQPAVEFGLRYRSLTKQLEEIARRKVEEQRLDEERKDAAMAAASSRLAGLDFGSFAWS